MSTSWAIHVFDIVNTAFDGDPVGFRRFYFQVSYSSDMTTTVRLGTSASSTYAGGWSSGSGYDSVTGAGSDYIEAASSSVAYATVAGVGGYFVVADFEGTGTLAPSGTMWVSMPGRNSSASSQSFLTWASASSKTFLSESIAISPK